MKSAHGIVDNPFKANTLLPKCLGKNTIKVDAGGKGFEQKRRRSGFNLNKYLTNMCWRLETCF